MKSSHVRQSYLKALWIYLIALLLLGLTFHSEAGVNHHSGQSAISR